ncbi:nucleoside recognition domain-containing protein [Kytococcus sedentarius]|uniref:nucleoside recognition domain-containing protein n=1 Tax=Kytococcus sedentarius TaxID=1276 RepID=UPI00019EB756|nr:nucleoside recognition domain-containing protein [Kytococcus sedentarius]
MRWRTVLAALGLQIGFGVLTLYWEPGQRALSAVADGVSAVIGSAGAGIDFLFGPVLPEEGSVFAFQVLPVIVFFASLTAVLFHLGVLQFVVNGIGRALGWALGTGRYESVNAAANIFVGQTEAPLLIKPYIRRLDESALFAVMVGGLSTVAGSVAPRCAVPRPPAVPPWPVPTDRPRTASTRRTSTWPRRRATTSSRRPRSARRRGSSSP